MAKRAAYRCDVGDRRAMDPSRAIGTSPCVLAKRLPFARVLRFSDGIPTEKEVDRFAIGFGVKMDAGSYLCWSRDHRPFRLAFALASTDGDL